jgi:hypothetical protein
MLALSTPGLASGQILVRIEMYDAPPYPADRFSDREPYDHRVRSGGPLAATLTDTLVCDVFLIITRKLDVRGVSVGSARNEHVKMGIEFYVEHEWVRIPGLRPWTHWNFVRSLNAEQRQRLGQEITSYARAHPSMACPP